MSTTSKSPRQVVKTAYNIASTALPDYSDVSSPHKYTQPQLLACLVLKEFLKLDYRGVVSLLTDTRDFRRLIHLDQVPHYTTLQKASRRLLASKSVKRLIDTLVGESQKRGPFRVVFT